jgi:hypothetical protein
MRKKNSLADFPLTLPVARQPSRRGSDRLYYQTTPEALKDLRRMSGLTQAQAAKASLSTLKEWQEFETGRVKMHPAIYRTFVLAIPKMKKALRKTRSA